MMNKFYISTALVLVFLFGVGTVLAWTGPTVNPTGGNVPAPINVGSQTQIKKGSFFSEKGIGAPEGYFNSLIINNPQAAKDKILSSDDSNGTAVWKTKEELGLGGNWKLNSDGSIETTNTNAGFSTKIGKTGLLSVNGNSIFNLSSIFNDGVLFDKNITVKGESTFFNNITVTRQQDADPETFDGATLITPESIWSDQIISMPLNATNGSKTSFITSLNSSVLRSGSLQTDLLRLGGAFGNEFVNNEREKDAGLIKYLSTKAPGVHSLDIYGGGKTVGTRLVNVYDNLNVHGTINVCDQVGACNNINDSSYWGVEDGLNDFGYGTKMLVNKSPVDVEFLKIKNETNFDKNINVIGRGNFVQKIEARSGIDIGFDTSAEITLSNIDDSSSSLSNTPSLKLTGLAVADNPIFKIVSIDNVLNTPILSVGEIDMYDGVRGFAIRDGNTGPRASFNIKKQAFGNSPSFNIKGPSASVPDLGNSLYNVTSIDSVLFTGFLCDLYLQTSCKSVKEILDNVLPRSPKKDFVLVAKDTNGGVEWRATSTLNISGGDTNWIKTGNNISNSNTGNVGIGTGSANLDSAFSKLTVKGLNKTTLNLTTGSGTIDDSAGLVANNRASFYYDGVNKNVVISDNEATKDIVFRSGLFERLRIKAKGNIGIGTNDPKEELELINNKDGATAISVVNSDKGAISTAQVGASNGDSSYGDAIRIIATGPNADRSALTGGGGLPDPAFTPDTAILRSGSNISGGLIISSANGRLEGSVPYGTKAGSIQFHTRDDLGIVRQSGFTNEGSLGIGTTNPRNKLEVAGGIRVSSNVETGSPGLLMTDRLWVTTNPGVGKVLVSDEDGVASWGDFSTAVKNYVAGDGLKSFNTGINTTFFIDTGAIDLLKLAANSVNSSKIIDGSVGLPDLANNSVNSLKIVNGSVSLVDLAPDSIDSSKILNGSIVAEDIAPASIGGGRLMDNAVQAAKINAGSGPNGTTPPTTSGLVLQTVAGQLTPIWASIPTPTIPAGASAWTLDGNNISNSNTGNVGVGTNAPSARLHTNLNTPSTNTINSLLISRFTRPTTGGVKWGNSFDILLGTYGNTINSQSRVDFKLANGATALPDKTVMTLLGNGKVGIGITNPAGELDVVGSIRATGVILSDGAMATKQFNAETILGDSIRSQGELAGASLKINSTTQDYGKVLTADTSNTVTWQSPVITAFFDNVSINKSGSSNGISYTVSENDDWFSPGARDFAVLACPSGRTAISGGAICVAGNELSANGPGKNVNEWRISCGTDLNRIQRISVTCAKAN